MKRFFLLFCVLLLCLFTLELWRPVQHFVIIPWTQILAQLSGIIANIFDANVVSQGKLLLDRKTGCGVSIEAGCNGIEACLILIAAMLAYPSHWKSKLAGILIGILAIQAMNVVRIVSLFYLAAWDAEIFRFAHLYLWQALIMIDVLIVWLLWIRYLSRYSARKTLTHD